MRTLLGVHGPERGEDPRVVRRLRHRRFEEPLLRRRRGGHEAFDVVLERVERQRRGGRAGGLDNGRPVDAATRSDTRSKSVKMSVSGPSSVTSAAAARRRAGSARARTASLSPSRTSPNTISDAPIRLADPDHRRARERTDIGSCSRSNAATRSSRVQRADAAGAEAVGDQHGGGLAQPARRAGAAGRLRLRFGRERHDQHARAGRRLRR